MEGVAAQAVFEPVTASTAFEETVERLGTAIKLGLLGPGERLPPERELAARLGISRSTLRQALRALMEGGYLTTLRGRTGGTFVAERLPPAGRPAPAALTLDWRETVDRRLAIETGAAVLAAERADRVQLEAMRNLVLRMDEASSYEDYRRADMRFHLTLAEATRVAGVVADMTEIQSAMTELIRRIPHPREVLAHANRQHRQLVAALEGRQALEAVRITREHLRGTEHILAAFFPDDQGVDPPQDQDVHSVQKL
ncbi:MAG: FadR/GntR family transcriptional regulator [Gaiellaceae bacterium]